MRAPATPGSSCASPLARKEREYQDARHRWATMCPEAREAKREAKRELERQRRAALSPEQLEAERARASGMPTEAPNCERPSATAVGYFERP